MTLDFREDQWEEKKTRNQRPTARFEPLLNGASHVEGG